MEQDTCQEILEELKKITGSIERQKKYAKWVLLIPVVVVLILIWAGITTHYEKQEKIAADKATVDWSGVSTDEAEGDYKEALEKATQLLSKTPNSPYAHRRLALLYLEMNDLKNAHASAKKAHTLLPVKRCADLLTAIETRMGIKKPEIPQTKESVGTGYTGLERSE